MKAFAGRCRFDVKWFPFQLNADASTTGVNKGEMYRRKFGWSDEQMRSASAGMQRNFTAAGLPYLSISDDKTGRAATALTGNTFNSHRLINYAGHISAEVQDRVVEELFRNYFAEGKFLNDPAVLLAAAVKGGIPADAAAQFVKNEASHREETASELQYGRRLGVTGVPHFIIKGDQGEVALGGAQPLERFRAAFERVSSSS